MMTSSSSFAVIGYRTLELYYFIIIYFILLLLLLFFFKFNLTVVRGRRSSEGGLKMEEKTQVSEVGFEPGTFRSCVEHSNHYATEARPIPDVLLVLVALKHIHRNVTTTLQSRFTPTPTPQATHSSFIILFFYFILFYFILFYFILFYFILFYFILFYFILFYFILFYFIKYLALFADNLHPNPHCSPKFGLYRFFNIFLQNPYLLTWRIWRKNIRTRPIFQHFSSKSLSFNMAHLADNETGIYTTAECNKNKRKTNEERWHMTPYDGGGGGGGGSTVSWGGWTLALVDVMIGTTEPSIAITTLAKPANA